MDCCVRGSTRCDGCGIGCCVRGSAPCVTRPYDDITITLLRQTLESPPIRRQEHEGLVLTVTILSLVLTAFSPTENHSPVSRDPMIISFPLSYARCSNLRQQRHWRLRSRYRLRLRSRSLRFLRDVRNIRRDCRRLL